MTEKSPGSDNTKDPTQPKPKGSGGVQPKTHAPKTRAQTALRRQKIIRAVLDGKSATQAGIDSGLSPKTAAAQVTAILKEPETQLTLRAAMEKLGMNDEYLALHHKKLIEGTKVISANIIMPGSGSDLADAGSMTRDFIEVPDNIALAKGLELAYKLTGRLKERHEVDIKPPVTIIIRKFCSPTDPSAGVDMPPAGCQSTEAAQ